MVAETESARGKTPFIPGQWCGVDVYEGQKVFSAPILVLDCRTMRESRVFALTFRAADPELAAEVNGWMLYIEGGSPHALCCTRLKGPKGEPEDCCVVITPLSDAWLAQRYPLEAPEIRDDGWKEMIESASKPYAWEEPYTLESDQMVTEDEILGYCAFRFRGHAWARERGASLTRLADTCFSRKEDSAVGEHDFATFYSLMCRRLKWGRGLANNTHPDERRAEAFFLRLCEEPPPCEHRHERFIAEWDRLFWPMLEECRVAFRRRQEEIESLNQEFGEHRSFISAGGLLIIQKKKTTKRVEVYGYCARKGCLLVARNPDGPGCFDWHEAATCKDWFDRVEPRPWHDAVRTFKQINATRVIVDRTR